MTAVSRRTVIAGFATGVATGITPAVMANPVEFEGPAERVERLMQELSDALDDYQRGQFRAIVEPAAKVGGTVLLQNMNTKRPSLEEWLSTADPSYVIEYHATRLGEALHKRSGDRPYLVNIHDDDNMVLCAPCGSREGLWVRHV